MDIQSIPIITVSYNAPDLIAELLSTFRQHYSNKVYVIDGSEEQSSKVIGDIVKQYDNTEFIHFDYNIHHGPGMAWAISNINLSGPVLVIDSDVSVLRGGFIESLASQLESHMYGVGQLNYVNRGGFDVTNPEGALLYLHPALMLCNIEVVKQWPLPVKHGAPMIEAMTALHDAGKSDLLHHVDWVREDFSNPTVHNFIRHDWQGTVKRTGSYNLDEWLRSVIQAEQERPAQNAEPQNYNRDLLSLIPINARGVVEVGCNNGALANAYKAINSGCVYIGIEIDPDNVVRARAYCDTVLHLDIESVNDEFFKDHFGDCNVWVFGDMLDRLRDPWEVLAKIRRVLPADGCVIACLSNAQHWSIQAKLNVGDFRYEDSGLLDCSKIRFFTRATLFELFQDAGFRIEQGFPHIFSELKNENVIAAIKLMAVGVGADPELALQDAMPSHYLVRAVPDGDGSIRYDQAPAMAVAPTRHEQASSEVVTNFYCIAHQACTWSLPDFMTIIGTGDYVPEHGIAMSRSFPELANKNRYLGEYVALYAIRKMLLESNAKGFVGVCHYRRFALTKQIGELRGFNFHAHPDLLKILLPEHFYGNGDTPIIPAMVHFAGSVQQQYAASCIARDLLLFFGDAVDCGVITNEEAVTFLSNNAFIPAPTVAFIPVEWFIEIVHALEMVMSRFYRYHYVEREGYLARSMAFCCERLHALLLAKRAETWGLDKLIAQPLTLLVDSGDQV